MVCEKRIPTLRVEERRFMNINSVIKLFHDRLLSDICKMGNFNNRACLLTIVFSSNFVHG